MCPCYTNLVNAPSDVGLQDISTYSMLSCRGFCKKVNTYLEGIAKMKKSQMKKEVPASFTNNPCLAKAEQSSGGQCHEPA